MLNFFFLVMMALTFAQEIPEPARRLEAFAGNWVGHATMEFTGKPVSKMKGYQNCQMVANSWAVHCVGQFKGENFEFNEAFQGSYDLASDKIVWAVTYSTGPQSFSVTGNWNKSDLILSRKMEIKGQPFEETGTWKFINKHVRDLEANSTLAGKPFGRITVHLEKR